MHMAPRAAAWVAWAAWTCSSGQRLRTQADDYRGVLSCSRRKRASGPLFLCLSEMRLRRKVYARRDLAGDRITGTLGGNYSRRRAESRGHLMLRIASVPRVLACLICAVQALPLSAAPSPP